MAAMLRLLPLLLILVPATLLLAPVQMAGDVRCKPLARAIPVLWHRLALRLVGVRVHVQGKIPAAAAAADRLQPRLVGGHIWCLAR